MTDVADVAPAMAPAVVGSPSLDLVTGWAALAFSVVYLASDVIELGQGGFSTFQLLLTYAGEAAIPLFVLGLYAAQRPAMGRLGLVAALAYAYAFVFFTGTVSYALVEHTADWEELQRTWGASITVHSIVMVVAGVGFGVAVVRAQVLPRWTGWALVVGMALMAASVGAPEVAQTAAAGVRDLAFATMGVALLRERRQHAQAIERWGTAMPDSQGTTVPNCTSSP
ncbi:hypothetical protein BH10ACT1_BH10ACT1_01310 [soil metagenome]